MLEQVIAPQGHNSIMQGVGGTGVARAGEAVPAPQARAPRAGVCAGARATQTSPQHGQASASPCGASRSRLTPGCRPSRPARRLSPPASAATACRRAARADRATRHWRACRRSRGVAQHSTAQHSTARHSTAQHSTAQHSIAQHGTAQHSTAQHSMGTSGAPLVRARVAIAVPVTRPVRRRGELVGRHARLAVWSPLRLVELAAELAPSIA